MVTKNKLFTTIILSVSTCISACGQRDYYYGNSADSTQQSVIDLNLIAVEGLHIGDRLDQALKILSTPDSERSGVDEISDYRFKILYYGSGDKSFFYFYDSGESGYILEEFELADPRFSVHIGSTVFKVGDSLSLLQQGFPKSYSDYVASTDPYKAFRIIVFKNGKRMGLEILFLVKEEKIYNISTRYDE